MSEYDAALHQLTGYSYGKKYPLSELISSMGLTEAEFNKLKADPIFIGLGFDESDLEEIEEALSA